MLLLPIVYKERARKESNSQIEEIERKKNDAFLAIFIIGINNKVHL